MEFRIKIEVKRKRSRGFNIDRASKRTTFKDKACQQDELQPKDIRCLHLICIFTNLESSEWNERSEAKREKTMS